MKRILPIALGIFVLLVAALLIGPSFVDWNKYKPQIVEQVKSAAGYDVVIAGDISLSLLPLPQLEIEGLSVKAPRGQSENLLTMKRADVSVDILPLLSGAISIDTVRLVSPDIQLETLPDGTNSWLSDQMLAEQNSFEAKVIKDSAPKSSNQNISIEKLEIKDGRVSFNNRQTGQAQSAEQINLDIGAQSLQGPFKVGGSLVYGGKTIEIEGETDRSEKGQKDIPVDVTINLPENSASLSFKGIVATDPMEVQGKLDVSAENLAQVLALTGGEQSPAMARKLAFSGLVTANERQLSSEDITITFGEAKGSGSVAITNLKDRDPVMLDASMAFKGTLNLDQLAPPRDKGREASVEEKVAKGQTLEAKKGFLPESISLPFPIDGQVRMTADGVQMGGAVYKGVVMNVAKKGAAIDLKAGAMDMPGKTSVEGEGSIRFATASVTSDNGMIYADPTVTFSAVGSSEQLPTLLRAFAPDQDGNAALEIWKNARFDINGQVTQNTVKVSDSTMVLDQTTLGLNAAYRPDGLGGKPDVTLDLATDTVDVDSIMARLNGQKKQVVQKDPAAKTDVKTALEPVRNFSLPVNLTFDLSAQKAIYNGQAVNGIRIKGKAAGQRMALDVASVQDYMGGAASLKGNVANLKDLSGIDLTFYGRTNDAKALMQSFKMDTSKLPQTISEAEANIAAKGKADSLNFTANIKALSGELQAAGIMTGLLETPSFSNLSVGAKHPNLVKAIQIVNPGFTGGPGLEKPFDIYAKAVKNGNAYDLSDLKATLGVTTIGGALKIDTSGAKPSLTGSVNAGELPLDSLLGAKTSAAKSSSGGLSSSSAEGGKWSKVPVETGWMHSINLDLALSAQSITYGGWNFTKPQTKIVLKDGNLTVSDMQSGLFGGSASLNAKVQDPADPKQPLSIVVQSKMNDVALEPLMFALSGSNKLKATGDVSLNMDVQTTGLSPHALVSGLQGTAGVNGKDVVFKGFDLAQIGLAFVDSGKPMDRINSIVTGATQGGETRFDTINGAYNIMQGIVQISSMQMDGPAANIKSTGTANLPSWMIDTIHTITFKQAKDAGSFDVVIKGPLDNPGNTFGRGLFNDVLTRRLQQKAVEKLPDVLGKDLTGKLQGLGILPQQQAPAPQPAQPAADPAAQPDASPEAEPAPAQAPQQEQPQSLEDQIKKDPSKAMEGLLKSLGR